MLSCPLYVEPLLLSSHFTAPPPQAVLFCTLTTVSSLPLFHVKPCNISTTIIVTPISTKHSILIPYYSEFTVQLGRR